MTPECRSRRAFTDVLWKQIEPPRRAMAKAGGAAASPLIEAAYAAAVQQIADWKSSLNLELRDLE